MSPGFLLDADGVIDHFNGIEAITRAYEEVRFGGSTLTPEELARLGRLADLIPQR